jgi:glycine cleavage system H protein
MSPSFLEAAVDKFILRVKEGLVYSGAHVWVDVGEQVCSLGITDYAQRKDGDIVFIELLPAEGVVEAGNPVALYETIKAALEVSAPFDCEVVEYNQALRERPELMNDDPYGAGWVARVVPVNHGDLEALLSPEEYFDLMKEEAGASSSGEVSKA